MLDGLCLRDSCTQTQEDDLIFRLSQGDTSVSMQALKATSSILCLDVPPNILIGVDVFGGEISVPSRFCGLKLVPPGFHVIRAKPGASEEIALSPWQCELVHLEPDQVIVRRWNSDTCSLDPLPKDGEEVDRLSHGVHRLDFDQQLAPYNLDLVERRRWRRLSRFIDPLSLSRLSPHLSHLCSSSKPLSRSEQALISQTGPPDDELLQNSNQQLHFTLLPTPNRLPSDLLLSGPSELTEILLFDRSKILVHILRSLYSGNERLLLAEFQLAFIAFWLMEIYEGFEQWKSLIVLFCHSKAAVLSHPSLFSAFVEILLAQLRSFPDDSWMLFQLEKQQKSVYSSDQDEDEDEDDDEGNLDSSGHPVEILTDQHPIRKTKETNFLWLSLHRLFENVAELESAELELSFVDRCHLLREYSQQKFQRRFDLPSPISGDEALGSAELVTILRAIREGDEDGPTLVDVPPEILNQLLRDQC